MNFQYALYVKSILNLIGTMVIKDAYTASKMNERLLSSGFAVDLDLPSSWKYYLNLSGVYHVADTIMKVRARETGELIDFTRANLLIYRDTRNAYSWGSTEYKDLVRRYPNQTTLINGILNPLDIITAIGAEDHTILRYNTALVESGEEYLIIDLQNFINDYFHRWYNSDYALYQRYYHLKVMEGLGSKLVLEVLRLREKNTHTDRVHSYHIRQYLGSFSEAGREFDFMPKKLQLWLYRNIRYLNLNIGLEETFDSVVKHVMTDLGFSLVGYNLEHQYVDSMQETLDPEVILRGDVLNGIYPARGGLIKSVSEMVEKENPLARDNLSIADESIERATEGMQLNQSHTVKTKVLESNAIDNTDSEPFTLAEISLNHWIYLSHYGLYSTRVLFKNPSDGAEYSLSAKDAFTFFLYAYNMANGIELVEIPKVQAHRVLRVPEVTFAELRSLEPEKLVSDASIRWIRSLLPVPSKMISTVAFKEFCMNVRSSLLKQRFHYLMMGDWYKEVATQKMVDRCYMSISIDLEGGKTYDQWLTEKEIETNDMSRVDWQTIADAILVGAVGHDYGGANSTRDVHAAMVRILDVLTSYSVQVIGDINQSPIRILNGKTPKFHIGDSRYKVDIPLNDITPVIADIRGKPKVKLRTDINMTVGLSATQQWVIYPVVINPKIGLTSRRKSFSPIPVTAPGFTVRPDTPVNLSERPEVSISDYQSVARVSIDDLILPTSEFEDYSKLTGQRLARFKAPYLGT